MFNCSPEGPENAPKYALRDPKIKIFLERGLGLSHPQSPSPMGRTHPLPYPIPYSLGFGASILNHRPTEVLMRPSYYQYCYYYDYDYYYSGLSYPMGHGVRAPSVRCPQATNVHFLLRHHKQNGANSVEGRGMGRECPSQQMA